MGRRMSVDTTDTYSGPYSTNGATTAFPFTFKALAEAEVSVEIDGEVASAGLYDVSLDDDGGGTVTFTTAPVTGSTLYVVSDPDFTQSIQFENGSRWLAEPVNNANDRAAVRDLKLKDRLDRSPQVPIGGGVEGMSAVVDADGQWAFASGTGADSALRTDMAASSGAGLVGWIRSATGAVARSVADWFEDELSVMDFIPFSTRVAIRLRTSTADLATYLASAVTAAAAKQTALKIPAGKYSYSVSPNFAIDYLHIVTHGRVDFYYTGTGDALTFDAGSGAQICSGVRFAVGNPVHIYAPNTAHNGIYVRSVHHSSIWANVHGCGPSPYAALYVAFAVCTEFHVVVSGNEDGGWYGNVGGVGGATPGIGYYLTRRGSSPVSETVSFCDFHSIVEGPAIGIQCNFTLGNNFWGTSEGCTNYGVLCDSTSNYDKFWGMDFELNTTADIYCSGIGVEFHSCLGDGVANLGSTAKLCEIIGGDYKTILVDTGSIGCTVENAVYNREALGGTFTDAGTDTTVKNVRDGVSPFAQWGTGSATYDPASLADGAGATTTVTVTGAKLGDYASATFSLDLQGITLTAWVSAANTVSVRFQNESGGTLDLASGTLRARIKRG